MRPRACPRLLPATLAAAAAATAVLLAGCGGSQPSASLPTATTPLSAPSATVQSSPAASPSQAVIAAYTGYFPASKAAEDGPASKAESVLAPWAASPYLGQVLSQMATYRSRGEEAEGYVTVHVTKVSVHGRAATVYDCQDASHAALASTRTGKVIPGTAGKAGTYLIAGLALGGDGRWRLTSLAHVAVPCSPASPSS
jgi:hypothetical protein